MLTTICTTHSTGIRTHTKFSSAVIRRAARLAGSTAAVALVVAATSVGLHAQSEAMPAAHPTLDLRASLSAPLDLSAPHSSSSSSSSSYAADDEARITEQLSHLSSSADQPPPRRTYSKPHYSDSSHNADGSNKYTFAVGGGFTLPIGGTHAYLGTSYAFQAGVGRNFNEKFGVLAQFDWDNFGLQSSTLNTLLRTYNKEILLFNIATPGNPIPLLTSLGGTSHVWSFTLNPMYNFIQSEKAGVYVIGGVGFYHKTANFTIPSVGTYCDPYYGCYQYAANQTIDKYTSNAVGFNGGFGFTYRPSRFAGERFYAEARYVYMNNQPRPYSEGSSSSTYYNVFPQNSAKTTYIPIKFGLRF